ncbi:MAG TPA: hypothetical protein QF525_03390, partial [Candidatus Thalassarchaeaceae archaeon]|nr:hypothetical protein [Candidatus Thalassarchaeaceae archaeon]
MTSELNNDISQTLNELANEISEIEGSRENIQDIPIDNEMMESSDINSDIPIVSRANRLRDQENFLLRIDRLLISGGTRLVLFMPMIVIIDFGLAQSYRNTTPGWWVDHVQEFAPVGMATGIHLFSLFILVADLTLLLILFRLLTITRRIFQLEAQSLTRAGLTFKSSHGYAEMRAIINGSHRQVTATLSLLFMATFFLAVALWLNKDGALSPNLVAFSTGSLLAGQGVYLASNQPRFNA